MDRRSAARTQENIGGGQRRPMMSRGAPRRPLPARHQPTPVDDEGSEHESEESERRQSASIDEEGSEHESAEVERHQSASIDEEGSEHESAEVERHQSASIDEEGSSHDPAEVEESSDNESRRRSQTRPTSNNQSFTRAAQTFETRVRSAWNRFELDRIPRAGTSPTPIVERGSTAIYHAPSILQFYFTNAPPPIHTESNSGHPGDNRAPRVSNTQHSPGRDRQNPRKRKRSETDDNEEDPESQRHVDTAPPDHPSDNRSPSISDSQPPPGRDTQNPRKRKRSGTDDDEEEPERHGPVDTVLAAIEGRTLSRADRDILLAALESAEMLSDGEVEGSGERESNGDEIQSDEGGSGDGEVLGDEEVSENGEGALDEVEMLRDEGVEGNGEGESNDDGMQEDEILEDDEGALEEVEMQRDEGISGGGEGPLDDPGIQGDEEVSEEREGDAVSQKSSDSDTIVLARSGDHQSRSEDETEAVPRGRNLSRTEGRHRRRAGSTGSEEDLYGSSVSPHARNRRATHNDRDNQPVADIDAAQSARDEGDEPAADSIRIRETPLPPHGRPSSGTTNRPSWTYESSEEMTTVSATVDVSNILGAADGRRTSRHSRQNSVAASGPAEGAGSAEERRSLRKSRQNSVAASGPAEGAGHAVSAQRHVEERRASRRNRGSRAGSIVPRESPLKQSSVPRQEKRGSSAEDSQADTRTPSRTNRRVRDSPEKRRATLQSIPEERPLGRPHIPVRHSPEMTSMRERQEGFDQMPVQPRSISPASRDDDLAAMGLGQAFAGPDSEGEDEEEEDEEDMMMETIPEERSNGDESGDDDAAGSGERETQRHPEQIDRHPREPGSKTKKTDAPPKPLMLHLKVTETPRLAGRKRATEDDEEAVPSAGSEGNTSPLTSLTSGSEEEQPLVKRPKKRQKTRRRGRD